MRNWDQERADLYLSKIGPFTVIGVPKAPPVDGKIRVTVQCECGRKATQRLLKSVRSGKTRCLGADCHRSATNDVNEPVHTQRADKPARRSRKRVDPFYTTLLEAQRNGTAGALLTPPREQGQTTPTDPFYRDLLEAQRNGTTGALLAADREAARNAHRAAQEARRAPFGNVLESRLDGYEKRALEALRTSQGQSEPGPVAVAANAARKAFKSTHACDRVELYVRLLMWSGKMPSDVERVAANTPLDNEDARQIVDFVEAAYENRAVKRITSPARAEELRICVQRAFRVLRIKP
jgi:hypothetical protein